MSSNNISQILQRQFLLINYDANKTLTENIAAVKSKKIIFEQNPRLDNYYGSEEYLKRQLADEEIRKAAEYPNFCPLPELTAEPPKNKLGASGVEALPENHCYYSTPAGGFFIPYEFAGVKTKFKTIDFNYISNMVDIIIGKRFTEEKISDYGTENKKLKDKEYSEYIEIIKSSLEESLLKYMNQISSFTIGADKYMLYYKTDWLLDDITTSFVKPAGYSTYSCPREEVPCQTQNGKWYVNPAEVDRRSDFDIFIDDWSTIIQVTVAVVAIVATIAFPPAGAAIFIGGVVVEVSFGIADAIRALHAGNETSAALSLIFAFIPIAFLRPAGKTLVGNFFSRGLYMEAVQTLSQKLLNSGLEATSTWIDYYKFWKTCSKEERFLMEQLLEHDNLARDKFFKELIKEGTEVLKDTSFIKKSLGEFFDKYKTYLNKGVITSHEALPILRRLWAKEAALYGTSTILTFISEFVGGVLDQNTKVEVEWIGKYMPGSDILVNLSADPSNINENIEILKANPQYQEVKQLVEQIPQSGARTDTLSNNLNKMLDFAYADSIIKAGNPVLIEPKDKFIKETINEKELNSKISNGWIWVGDILAWELPEMTPKNTMIWNQRTYVYMPGYKKYEPLVISPKNDTTITNIKK